MVNRTVPSGADALTVAALAVFAYAGGSVIHEALGHASACLISGGAIVSISSAQMRCSIDNRLILAAGTLMNGVAALLLYYAQRATSGALRYFCWLAMTTNLLAAAGYFLFSGIGGFGDWAELIAGLQPTWLFRVLLAVIGGVSYMLAVWFALRQLRLLIGSNPQRRIHEARKLTYLPYFTGGLLACSAAALNSGGWRIILLSAAASSFGGSSALLWMPEWLRDTRAFPLSSQSEPVRITRHWLVIPAAACVAVSFAVVLGPGVPRPH